MIPDAAEQDPARRRGRQGIGRAAVMIGVITVLARLVGFGRQVVFAHTVGTTCLGTAYTTANMVPNIIYDIVLGGALSSVVVPVLAGPAGASGEAAEAQARRIASALVTWTVLLLVPVSAALALAAHPIVSALLSGATGCPYGPIAGVGARMLIVFAPQVPLYGLAVVLYGILQSHRRFGAPALAPLLSSLVVIGAYAGFGSVGGGYVNRLSELPPQAEYLLSGGTTLGVLALAGTAVIPAWRLGLGARPTLRFPPGVAPRVRRLALAGVATLIAQDASTAAVIVLANRFGASGALVIYGFAWAVFVVPYAVLAVPIATSAFPELSDHGVAGAPDIPAGRFNLTAAGSTRAVMVASWLGAAVLIGACEPIARVFESRSAAAASVLALALAAFAPGLIGYGLSANLARVLFARRRNRAPALAIAGGWLLVIVADAAIVPFVPADRVVPVLGLGTTFGLTVSGIALLVLVHRECGAAALRGTPRAFLAGLAGCASGAAAGFVVSVVVSAAVPSLRAGELLVNVGLSVLVTAVVTGVFGLVVLCLDSGDIRTALSRLRTRPSLCGGRFGCGARVYRMNSAVAARPSNVCSGSGRILRRRSFGRPAADPPAVLTPGRHRMKTGGTSPQDVTFVLGTSAGGIGAHVRMLATGLAQRGIAVSVAGPSSVDARFSFSVTPSVTFSAVEVSDRPRAGDLAGLLRLRKLLLEGRGTSRVVHAHGMRAGALVVLALSSVRGGRRPRVVVTAHNAPPSGGGAARLVYRLLELVVGRRADLVLCVSPDLEARMRAAGARRVQRAVIAAADPSADSAAALPAQDSAPQGGDAPVTDGSAPGAGAGRPVVLAVGRLAAQKGLDVLLEAAATWRDLDPMPLVVLAGDGPLARQLRARAVALNAPAVFLGHRDDVAARLAAAAVFVLPSRWEGQPLVLQEALRAGSVIVATRVGGVSLLTGEDAALLVPPGDAGALGDAVRSVLTNPGLANRLAAAARARAGALPVEQDAVAAALAAYDTVLVCDT